MAKAKTKGTPKGAVVKSAAKAVAKSVKAKAAAAVEKVEKVLAKPKGAPPKAAKAPAKPEPVEVPAKKGAAGKVGKAGKAAPPPVEVPAQPTARPRASKLPPVGEMLNKRDLEQLLTAGSGRGVVGEGSLKGKLVVKDGFPYLHVIGRDKRELAFLLQGPDQEVLPAYENHKVSVSGLIKKTTMYGGTVDVRKWTARKADETPAEEAVPEKKLRFLSPGEAEQACNGGMGAGLVGFARLRGNLEMTGDEYFLVVSGAGTRQQVSFILTGKGAKSLRKFVGQPLLVTGVVEKTSGWGGKIDVETVEVKTPEPGVSRDNLQITHVEGLGPDKKHVEVMLNQGLTVTLQEKAGYTWAVEPTTAKRIGLRETHFEPSNSGPAMREFFFTPRNPGTFDVEFFLAKVFTPAQVAKTCVFELVVKP